MDNKNASKIFFPDESIFDLISEILAANGIKESIAMSMFKKDSSVKIVYKIAKDFASQKFSEQEALLNIKNQLKLSEKNAENILKEIQEKI
jgi:hypothetical protein